MGKAFESIKDGLTEAIADAVSKRYPVQLQWSADDAGWIATFPDLPGCSAWDATEAEALTESHDAAAAWLKACKAAGNPIPRAVAAGGRSRLFRPFRHANPEAPAC